LATIKTQVESPAALPAVDDILAALVAPPEKEQKEYPAPKKVKSGGGFHPIDYIAQEARNQSLGKFGEEFALRFEKARLLSEGKLNLADKIEWVSAQQGDWFGYDIKSYEPNGTDRFIEVKTTRYGKRTPFFASRNEVNKSLELDQRYHLYRAFDFDRAARLFVLQGPLGTSCRLDPVTFEARAG
jgi:hypothetical protein